MRQLRKVILDCKDAHMRKLYRAARKSVDRRKSSDPNSHTHPVTGAPRLSSPFDPSYAPRPSVDSQARSFNDPEDFDIDFDFDEPSQDYGFGSTSSNGTSSNALDLVMMRQPLHMAVLQYGKQSPAAGTASHHNSTISPIPHNTISRLGR